MPKIKKGKKRKNSDAGRTAKRRKNGADEFGRTHGQYFNEYGRKVYYCDPAQLSDASDGEPEDPRVKKMLKRVGGSRTKAFRGKEDKPRAVKNLVAEKKVGGKMKFQVQWKGMSTSGSDDTWEPMHKVKHLDAFVKLKMKLHPRKKSEKGWTDAHDTLLCKLTKDKRYRLNSGPTPKSFNIHGLALRLNRSMISVRNRLIGHAFIRIEKRKVKKKKAEGRKVLGISTRREADDFEEVKNAFVSKKVKADSRTKKMMAELGISPGTAPDLKVPKSKLKGHSIVLIVGATGSGKTTLLESLGELFLPPAWSPDKAVISEIPDIKEAMKCMSSIGFNSIPSWLKPHHVLSQGEQYRALLAKTIHECFSTPNARILLDDFTSKLDRTSARTCSASLQKCIRREEDFGDCQFILATSNYDIIPWLQPNLVIEITDGGLKYHTNPNTDFKFDVKALVDMNQHPREGKKCQSLELVAASHGDLEVKGKVRDCSKDPAHQLETKVEEDDNTAKAEAVFDYPFGGKIVFNVPSFPEKEAKNFNVGFITGPSGTGKTSTAHRYFGAPFVHRFKPNKPVVSYFGSADDARQFLGIVCVDLAHAAKTFDQLSSGLQERVNIALGLHLCEEECVVFDEFSSYQDRTTAKQISENISQFIRQAGRKVVLVACHEDLLHSSALTPDWCFCTKTLTFTKFHVPSKTQRLDIPAEARSVVFAKPIIRLNVNKVEKKHWPLFQEHHYKDPKLQTKSCYVAYVECENLTIPREVAVFCSWKCKAMESAATMKEFAAMGCSGTPMLEHRTVTLPDHQGLGYASRVCDATAEIMMTLRSAASSKTAHPRYGAYRNRSPLWKASSGNGKIQKKAANTKNPFGSKAVKEANPDWKRLQQHFKPKPYFIHVYHGRRADPEFFDSRVIFIQEGESRKTTKR